jgi:hypothetical protein
VQNGVVNVLRRIRLILTAGVVGLEASPVPDIHKSAAEQRDIHRWRDERRRERLIRIHRNLRRDTLDCLSEVNAIRRSTYSLPISQQCRYSAFARDPASAEAGPDFYAMPFLSQVE